MWTIVSICSGGGYKYARTKPLHPKANSNGLYPLHRVLAENKIGRQLKSDEVVHHKDGNKENNKISNLVVLTRSAHSKEHHKPKKLVMCRCAVCLRKFFIKSHVHRQRVERAKRRLLFCSRVCSGIRPSPNDA
mgnify:CR=1 FL=1